MFNRLEKRLCLLNERLDSLNRQYETLEREFEKIKLKWKWAYFLNPKVYSILFKQYRNVKKQIKLFDEMDFVTDVLLDCVESDVKTSEKLNHLMDLLQRLIDYMKGQNNGN